MNWPGKISIKQVQLIYIKMIFCVLQRWKKINNVKLFIFVMDNFFKWIEWYFNHFEWDWSFHLHKLKIPGFTLRIHRNCFQNCRRLIPTNLDFSTKLSKKNYNVYISYSLIDRDIHLFRWDFRITDYLKFSWLTLIFSLSLSQCDVT